MNPPAADGAPTTLPPPRRSLAVGLVLATIATVLGSFAAGDNHLAIDVTVLEASQRADLPGLDTIVRASNAIFGTVGALVLGAIFIVTALILHRPVFVAQLVIVIAIRLAGQMLKPVFDSPRPPEAYQPDPELVSSTLGYPSGHAYTASVITTMLVLFVYSLGVPRGARAVTIIVAVALALTAMFSRIAIGAHWPTDTIGGVMYGVATVALMQLITGAILARRQSTPVLTDRHFDQG